VRDSVADADDLRAAMARKAQEVNERKNAALEAKAARIRAARLESEGRHRPLSAAGAGGGSRSNVSVLAGAWRDGREDNSSAAGALMQSAAAADAALRKLAEAAAAAEARHVEAVEARRLAARGLSARGGNDAGERLPDYGGEGEETGQGDNHVRMGEREAAGARARGQTRRQPRPARGPSAPSRRVGRQQQKPKVPGKELQRLRDATSAYEAKAEAAGAQNGSSSKSNRKGSSSSSAKSSSRGIMGEVEATSDVNGKEAVQSEASMDRVVRGSR
jgi:hypothetical protein